MLSPHICGSGSSSPQRPANGKSLEILQSRKSSVDALSIKRMRILAIRNTLSSVRNESCTLMSDSNLAEIAARIIDKLGPLVDERFGDLIIGDALRESCTVGIAADECEGAVCAKLGVTP